LFDIYSHEEAAGGKRAVFNLLVQFGEVAVREALARLNDPRPFYVRNLLLLIKRSGNSSVLTHVKPLLRHPDQSVRMEAMSVLLKFRDVEATMLLKRFIRSSDPDVAFQAIAIAGQFRVKEAVPEIERRIRKVILFEAEYDRIEEIVRALGEIGDTAAIPALERLASSRAFYRKRRTHMQRVVFETLGKYPREAITGLLAIGERSGDETIRQLCRKHKERN
jgi:HEAT repeat protein